MRLRRWAVPAVPAALSLVLVLSTSAPRPFWQDSGIYLTALRELGVLYPPGFALYEILCAAWTRAFFFLDFIRAVHLFSAACAAGAAAAVALATRDLLRSRGPLLRATEEEPGALADACGMLSGVLLAGGYTFWFSGQYAKGYSFLFLVLALLIWRIVRADESGRPRDFTWVAILIGLAWQAHPSAALAGAALALFVAARARFLGPKGLAGRAALAAACALGPALLLLPLLAARRPWFMMGDPRGLGELLAYAAGRRFTGIEGAWGWDGSRVASFGLFLWEEWLGVGLALLAAGLFAARRAPRLLAGVALWTLPYALGTILFKIEGQHDLWFVAAWLPLYPVAGLGAYALARRAGPRALPVLAAAGVAATVWAAVLNYPLLNQRNYDLPERFGRLFLGVEPDAVVLLSSDDANGLASCLQRVRGERPDVLLVSAPLLHAGRNGGADWYEELLLGRHPFLRRPDYAEARRRFPRANAAALAEAAFLNAQAELGRPLYAERLPPPELLRPELQPVPSGVLWKFARAGAPALVERKDWTFPVDPAEVRAAYRRKRGQAVTMSAGAVDVRPQAYEERLLSVLLTARFRAAAALIEGGRPAPAVALLESILAIDPGRATPELLIYLGRGCLAVGELARAEEALVRVAASPDWRLHALPLLAELLVKRGDVPGARRLLEGAIRDIRLPPPARRELEDALRRLPR